jgi:hypothetical protein
MCPTLLLLSSLCSAIETLAVTAEQAEDNPDPALAQAS